MRIPGPFLEPAMAWRTLTADEEDGRKREGERERSEEKETEGGSQSGGFEN